MLAAVSALAPFLAQAPAPAGVTPDLQEAIRTIVIIMVLGAIPVIIACVNGVLSIIDRFKSKPPLHKEYATIARVIEIERDLKEFITTTERHRDGLNTELKSIARQMGEIAGRLGCRVPRRVASDSDPG